MQRLLAEAPAQCDALVINGDLFDFWFGWPGVQPFDGGELLPALQALAARMPVQIVGGNHDRWGSGDWAARLGLLWAPWEVELHVGGLLIRCHHGDGFAAGARSSRLLHAVVRAPLTHAVVGALPPRLVHGMMRRFGPSLDGAPADTATRRADLAAQQMGVERWLAARPDVDWLVVGHTHWAGTGRAATGGRWCNPGAFAFDGSYALLTADGVVLKQQR
jgi:UDP-2,3-diacylglucosamine pyrophosphatase LpxH